MPAEKSSRGRLLGCTNNVTAQCTMPMASWLAASTPSSVSAASRQWSKPSWAAVNDNALVRTAVIARMAPALAVSQQFHEA
jgi:hypothetical protein